MKEATKTELSDGRILLRPLCADDVDALYEAVRESIDEVGRWLPWCHPDYSRDETVAFINSLENSPDAEEFYSFAIKDAQTKEFLGGVGLNQILRVHQMANLGYWVRTSRTERGVASAAVRLIAGFGFRQLGLQRLEIVVATTNHASQRVAEKAGAVCEGVLRKRLLIHGQPHDAVMYSLVAEDMEEQR
ncbi:MAG: GNAT family N-acetyltransferase [Pyrinomonadaceae bacterium]|nr:GNAT family N-acetyltransferase [Pyrinomonadaceae bacterium]